MSVFNRLEIDVMQANELHDATNLAAKYKFPSLIIHPDLASEALMARGRAGGKFKLITPIDWPKGEIFGQTKLRGLSVDALDVEGFEILLTGGKTVQDTKNEINILTDFIKTHLGESIEVRFVLGTSIRNEDNIKAICEGFVGLRQPTYLRNDIHLKAQVSKANQEIHNNLMDLIRSIVRIPIKISGNISSLRTVAACNSANRFAVNLIQAKTIVKEFQQQPQELKQILTTEK